MEWFIRLLAGASAGTDAKQMSVKGIEEKPANQNAPLPDSKMPQQHSVVTGQAVAPAPSLINIIERWSIK